MNTIHLSVKKIATIIAGLFFILQMQGAPTKKEIQKINNSLIFDLFMNFELTEKNGNCMALIDFVPNLNSVNYKNLKTTTNAAGVKDQALNFSFTKNGTIEKIVYGVEDRVYHYDFVYNDNLLKAVYINNIPRISFGYDTFGRLNTITREKTGGAYEFNFNYNVKQNRADIKLIVIKDGERIPSVIKYYVTLDNKYRLESFDFDLYRSKNIKYNNRGDISSFVFSGDTGVNTVNYEYVRDEKQNWIKRTTEDMEFVRVIEY